MKEAVEALLEQWDVEVDQETEGKAGEFEIGDDLRLMHRKKRFNGLELDQYLLGDDQIGTEAAIEAKSFE